VTTPCTVSRVAELPEPKALCLGRGR
jgi:hypothetical protein